MNLTATRAMVRQILRTSRDQQWNMRSNGQFCLALDHGYQINIFDPGLGAEGRNEAHTHPWGFRSTIVAGSLWQHRYAVQRVDEAVTPTHIGVTLTPEDYKVIDWGRYTLEELPLEQYGPGQSYEIRSHEVHQAIIPVPGTVTLVERLDTAKVVTAFWAWGEDRARHMRALESSKEPLQKRPEPADWHAVQGRVIDAALERLA